MNNSVALLYNFNEEKLKMIKMVCMMMQVRFKEVARAEYEQPLGALLGISGIENHGAAWPALSRIWSQRPLSSSISKPFWVITGSPS